MENSFKKIGASKEYSHALSYEIDVSLKIKIYVNEFISSLFFHYLVILTYEIFIFSQPRGTFHAKYIAKISN